jgi:hypothetical protein
LALAQEQSGAVVRVRGLGSRACRPSQSLISSAARSCVDGLLRVALAYRIAAFANQRHCRRRARTSLQFIRFPLSLCRRSRGDRAQRRESPRASHSQRVSGFARGIDNGAADPAALEALIGTDWTRPSSEANLGTMPRRSRGIGLEADRPVARFLPRCVSRPGGDPVGTGTLAAPSDCHDS